MENIKKDILSVEVFTTNRPDMSIHTESAIQSAIYQTATLLDSETNGLIAKVWDYNAIDPEFAKDNPLYRTEWELSQIVEAFIAQTQYSLNMGNDFTQGGGSYSIGGINSSFSRPIERETIAPSVHKLLQNARVYHLQDFSISTGAKIEYCNPLEEEPITRSIGDDRYVKQSQPDVPIGNVAVVDKNHLVNFANPTDLNFGFYSANRIKQWNSNEYVTIDKINSLAFFGDFLWGFGSAVQRGEIYEMIAAVNLVWRRSINYKAGTIVPLVYDVPVTKKNIVGFNQTLTYFLALKDSIGIYPLNDTTGTWEKVEVIDVDVTKVIEQVYNKVLPYVDTMFNKYKNEVDVRLNTFEENVTNTLIPTEIKTQLDKLPTIDNIIYPKNIAHNFTTKALFDLAKVEYNILETDYIVEENGTIFGHGENGEVVGDGLLKQSDLPNIRFWFSIRYGNIGYENTPNISHKLPTQFYYDDASTDITERGGEFFISATIRQFVKVGFDLNGDVEQTQFIPKYTQKYMVTFNKDIIKKSVVKVENAEVSFKDIKGALTDNTSAYNLLDWMNSGFRQIDAGEDGLLKTDFTLRNVSKLNGFDNNFSYTMSNSQNALKLNYNIKDGVEVWTGNYLNGKEIYINKITANVSAGTETFIFHNVEDIVSINAFLTIGNMRTMLTGISQVEDGIAIKSMEDGDVVLTITYTKRNGN